MTSTRKKFKYQTDNSLRGAYGETDLEKKTVRINKKRHKAKGAARINKNGDGSERLIDTIVHEHMHATHPKMHERTVRKKTKTKLKKMGPKQKSKYYSKVK